MKKIIIKEGKNWAENDSMLPTIGTIWKRQYELTESCLYQEKNTSYGINKLWGVSGFPYHKRNSVRICWAPIEEVAFVHDTFVESVVFRIYATAYVNGVREIRGLTTVKPGQRIDCLISNQGNNASVWINGISTTFKVRIPLITYTLPAYFGGIPPAPHDMTIIRLS
jgi:hypothetical protein